jgi:hypothetical protein
MVTASLVILVVAVILFLLAAINWPQPSPVALGWLGLFFFALYFLIGGYK